MIEYAIPTAQGWQGSGSTIARLLKTGFNMDEFRPFIGEDGRNYVVKNVNGIDQAVLTNTEALLNDNEWKIIDTEVVDVVSKTLNAVADLRGRGLERVINGFGKTVLEYRTRGTISGAIVHMDPVRRSERDRPMYDRTGIPLPLIQKDFSFTARELEVAKNGGDLDLDMIREASEKVAEEAEKILLGLNPAFVYATYSLWGYLTLPSRATKTLTAPTDPSWDPSVLFTEMIDMVQKSIDHFHPGPWVAYFSPAWSKYLLDDYSAAKGDDTVREHLLRIPGLQDIKISQWLTGFRILLVEMDARNVREVIGMDIRTIQWTEEGGMEQFWKIMAMMLPLFRVDKDGNTGVVDGATV